MAQRRDARRNRERLLSAARDVFQESGASAPLDLVARRAGVGRATLYRNFPDRVALLAALFEERLAELEELVTAYQGDDVFERLVAEFCRYELGMPGFGAVLSSFSILGNPALARLDAATERLLARALERSVHAGVLRADLVAGDAVTVVSMLNGVLIAHQGDAAREALGRALELVLDGVRAPARIGAATPEPIPGAAPAT